MSTLTALLLLALPIVVAGGGGYLLGKDVASNRNEEARWNAFDKALDAGTDEAFGVYYAAYPRERQ